MIAPVVAPHVVAGLDHTQVVLADVRWYLDGRDGREAFEQSHIAGAVWVDLEHALAAHGLPATEGRHPFPTPEAFATEMGALGIGDETVVVAYDDTGGLTAGRLVVMLRMLGRNAAVLDGGLEAWVAAGLPTATGPAAEPAPHRFTATPWPSDRLATADEALALAAAGGAVIDARSLPRFTGEQALIDPRPGHIPGARSAPWSDVISETGALLPADELKVHYAALGITEADTPSVAYCGSGVSACMNILAMEHAGLTPARLYVASWSGWSADPTRPTELGQP
ncbi:MAG TPA: sulfurtransferase [Ilumatobacteraceae bacterium]|nr:sulfurtransferase [Ilumatobacteraceae bacterium]